ncbi:SDR family NAD(P)-dependent oxidoreductase [Consotaella salsifontis]|uniref:3-oxoacyl-[acyl-carrier protein] reductase n=1 Tax=Consotaella salsifontis TaxID=1365950 RepID=A0A1T4TCG4_9HYPH|nr:3-oxoacyl-ACP reductase family protein [Consotaella salsifontis]SKA38113.1 3-oxoacyl-[acyl-carrier protein] reductase [Consotaella salsifontis]
MSAASQLEGKVVLVTGGSRGIGAGISRRFASLCGRVAIAFRSDALAAQNLANELDRASGGCIAIKADIANPDDIRSAVAATVDRFGRIDTLVNCAGIGPYRPLGQMDADFVRSLLETNVMGTVLMTQEVLPHMGAGGRIINFASALAFRPIPTSSVYSATKAAVITLTHAFAKELGPRGITVNAIAPGVIETDMTTKIVAERGDQIMAMTPLGRIGQTDDIAGIVTFLASPDAGWITGRTIIADGGMT